MAAGAAIAGAIGTIASLGASIGIPLAIDLAAELKNKKKGVDYASLIGRVDAIMNQIQKKSVKKFNEAQRQLQALPSNIGSASLSEFLTKWKKERLNTVRQYESIVNDLAYDANRLGNSVQAYGFKSSMYKNTKTGQKEAKGLVDTASDVAKDYERRINSVVD